MVNTKVGVQIHWGGLSSKQICIYIYGTLKTNMSTWSPSVSPKWARYGLQNGTPRGAPYGAPYGAPHGAPYGAPCGVPYGVP